MRLDPLADRLERTTDATPTDCARYSQQDNTVMLIALTAIARQVPAATNAAGYVRLALIKKEAGVMSQVGTTITLFEQESNVAYACVFALAGQDIAVRCTGVAATTIDWSTFLNGIVLASLG